MLLKNWDFFRILRLVLGILSIGMAIYSLNLTYALIGSILLLQAIFNMSCGVGGCGYPQYKKATQKDVPDISFTEITSNKQL